jgi:hypothetical protein
VLAAIRLREQLLGESVLLRKMAKVQDCRLVVFKAIPVFLKPLRLTRRKFKILEKDRIDGSRAHAYTVTCEAIYTVRQEIKVSAGAAGVH